VRKVNVDKLRVGNRLEMTPCEIWKPGLEGVEVNNTRCMISPCVADLKYSTFFFFDIVGSKQSFYLQVSHEVVVGNEREKRTPRGSENCS